MAIVTSNDWIPHYVDTGYDDLIKSLLKEHLEFSDFALKLNQNGSLPKLNDAMVMELVKDVYTNGLVPNIIIDGKAPQTVTSRPSAPTGLGQNATDIYFSAPASGSYQVNWYKNSELIISRVQDLGVLRGVTKNELGTTSGDVVQVAYVDNNVVSYWARIAVS